LEEATFYQYGYGQSASLVSQAGRLLSGFVSKKPFTSGNEATALIASFAFLKMNGIDVNLMDDIAPQWLDRASKDSSVATEAFSDIMVADPNYNEEHEPSVRETVLAILDAYPKTIARTARGMAMAV
jgi:prophage maintenance system killer protein